MSHCDAMSGRWRNVTDGLAVSGAIGVGFERGKHHSKDTLELNVK